MDFTTVVGILVAFGAVALAAAVGGVDLRIFYERYEAFVLVLGGTMGATLISFPFKTFARGIGVGFRAAFARPPYDERDVIATFVEYADIARRHGLLDLEVASAQLEDAFMRKGITLVVDGHNAQTVRRILETEVIFAQERDAKAEAVFTTLGGYSPTLGIIGTVLGLIAMLKGLGSVSSVGAVNITASIGTATAQAFVATFFGILTANLLWLPIASKIRERSKGALLMREIMIEGVLSIQAGDNPRLLEEKLNAFLEPVDSDLLLDPQAAGVEPAFAGA